MKLRDPLMVQAGPNHLNWGAPGGSDGLTRWIGSDTTTEAESCLRSTSEKRIKKVSMVTHN
jgi:hypothetical protein